MKNIKTTILLIIACAAVYFFFFTKDGQKIGAQILQSVLLSDTTANVQQAQPASKEPKYEYVPNRDYGTKDIAKKKPRKIN